MELGEKLRQARMEAGLSQRQLCGDIITRNMLSLIEHGTARPSMETLQALAFRLGKSVSYFLEENALLSPNQAVMEAARLYFDSGDWNAAAHTLEEYQSPDPVYDREKLLLQTLAELALAEQVISEGRFPYALELLARTNRDLPYCSGDIARKRLLLLGRIPGQQVSSQLPSLDPELQLRAQEALAQGDPERARCLLDAVQDPGSSCWNLLRGQLFFAQNRFQDAASCLHLAETAFPRETAPLLEQCYRELEDFKQAYHYACKQK